MGRTTEDDRDYDVVKAKVPKRDKAGNDITGDKIGPGGRRREDGTLSAMAYDFELFEEDDDTEERLLEYAWDEQREIADREESIRETVDFIFAFIEAATEFLEEHPEVAVAIANGVTTLGRKVADGFRSFKAKLTPKKSSHGRKRGRKLKAEEVLAERVLIVEENLLPAPAVISEEARQQTMSIEEARAEVLNLLAHYIEIKKSLQRLSNANIIEMQKLGFDGVIARLESIVQQYPALMDESTGASVLNFNLDELERNRVKEVLRIDSFDGS